MFNYNGKNTNVSVCGKKKVFYISLSMHITIINTNTVFFIRYKFNASMQVRKYASMQVCKYASIQVCKYASMQVCKYASMQICKYAGMQA